jgi:hypothetical protein
LSDAEHLSRIRPQLAGRAGSVSREVNSQGARVENEPWFRIVARAGIAARGVIYVLLGLLAFDIGLNGSAPAQPSGQGALQEVARQPAAPLLLVALAAGLGAYALWRLVQAAAGRSNARDGRAGLLRLGWLAIAAVYLALCLRAVELIVGRSSSSGPSSDPRPWAAKVLSWPGGPELLGLGGACLVIGGASLAVWGFVRDYEKDLALERLARALSRVVKALGALGDLSRGFLIGLIGLYLLSAAILGDPRRAKSTDSALKSILRTGYGPELIGLVAAGLCCFALFSFCEARLRRL